MKNETLQTAMKKYAVIRRALQSVDVQMAELERMECFSPKRSAVAEVKKDLEEQKAKLDMERDINLAVLLKMINRPEILEQHRKVLAMKCIEGLSTEEVAKKSGYSKSHCYYIIRTYKNLQLKAPLI